MMNTFIQAADEWCEEAILVIQFLLIHTLEVCMSVCCGHCADLNQRVIDKFL